MSKPTNQQRRAIEARGNVLVTAGAGAGKTRTLVERCLGWILGEEMGSVDRMLMVTFTEAAATEMRQRMREGLEAAQAAAPSQRLLEQLALLETAHISTLHSFCFQLISEHFYELKASGAEEGALDGPLRVLSAERSRLLAGEAMDAVLDSVYDDKLPGAAAIQELIRAHGGDWDAPTRAMVNRLHEYRHSLRDPGAWLAGQKKKFQAKEATEWVELLERELKEWRMAWEATLNRQAPANPVAAEQLRILMAMPKDAQREDFAMALEGIENYEAPRGTASGKKAIKEIFTEAAFLRSVAKVGGTDPLAEDWGWARPAMLALLDLTEAYGREYARMKRAAGGVDFQDLEQFALRLLWQEGRRTTVAEQWQKKFRLLFVDEYQDINDAQDEIIRALGREGAEANRFLVGDVKQSIYGFRLANPEIFKRRHQEWNGGAAGAALALTENFRSHEGILGFVNALCGALMGGGFGGERYDESNRLVFGDRANREALACQNEAPLRVELHLRPPKSEGDEEDEEASASEREARMIGERLRQMKEEGVVIQSRQGPRGVQWSDMAVLLRAPRGKAEAYAKAFSGLGIPLAAARTGFYDTMEARDLLNLLRTLDNPLQDLPLLGVLGSPLAGFTHRELAQVRIGRERGHFWGALVGWHEQSGKKDGELREKVAVFLKRFHDWRTRARQKGVAACLEQAVDETHYAARLGTMDRGAQRKANVERFLQLTRNFDAERGEGVQRFVKMVEAQQENEIDMEPAAAPATDAVRLMSIHQSKGLEFPVVALGDLGKEFNLGDTRERVIVDEELGMCPQIKAPGATQFYPSLAHWVAQRRQKRETVGEEARLLYVALTRAMEWLILGGIAAEKTKSERWKRLAEALPAPDGPMRGRSYLDWIGAWLTAQEDGGALELVKIVNYNEAGAEEAVALKEAPEEIDLSPEIGKRLDWSYPEKAATEQAAKSSVTALRQQMAEEDEEAQGWFGSRRKPGVAASEVGSAHHLFLEASSIEALSGAENLGREAERLREEGVLTQEQHDSLDLEALTFFWQSETGKQLLEQKDYLRRELPFTARFSGGELTKDGLGAEEFVVVQGVVDLAAILPEEIWIVDFKTDQFEAKDLDAKVAQYRPQLELYGRALERTYKRPVTRLWLSFLDHRKIVLL